MAEQEILTVEEVAKYIRVSERTIYDWAQKGLIPCGKLGATWRFKGSDIENWVNARLSSHPPKNSANKSFSLESLIKPERIKIMDFDTKEEVLNCLIDCFTKAPKRIDRDELAEAIFHREKLMSTGIGLGVAIPHVRLSSVSSISMAAGLNQGELKDYESLDGQPVRLIFMVVAADNQHAQYLRLLSLISSKIKDALFRERLVAVRNTNEFYREFLGTEDL